MSESSSDDEIINDYILIRPKIFRPRNPPLDHWDDEDFSKRYNLSKETVMCSTRSRKAINNTYYEKPCCYTIGTVTAVIKILRYRQYAAVFRKSPWCLQINCMQNYSCSVQANLCEI